MNMHIAIHLFSFMLCSIFLSNCLVQCKKQKVSRKKPKLSSNAPVCMDNNPNMYSLESYKKAQDITIKGFSSWIRPGGTGRKKALSMWEQAVSTSALALDARHKLALIELNKGNANLAVDIWNNSLSMLSDMHRRIGYAEPWDTVMSESNFVHGTATSDALPHKLRHDAEQLRYLASLDIWSEVASTRQEYYTLADMYWNISVQLEALRPSFTRPGNEHGYMSLRHDILDSAMGGIWGRMWLKEHQLKLPELQPGQRVVRQRPDMSELMDAFRRDRVVVVDDVLTDEALHMAYEALLRCPVWHEVKPWGYLGAYPSSGLAVAHPVFLAIGQQLPEVFKGIYDSFVDPSLEGDNDDEHSEGKDGMSSQSLSNASELNMVWAYKYDNSGSDTERAGIGIHADDALLNINMWLTPDEANVEEAGALGVSIDGGGGLIVYKDLAPPGWSMLDNTERDADHSGNVRDMWLGRDNITVSYKQNRMVLFDSERYHRTAAYNFKPGYRNRRINLTFLYGNRRH